MTAAVTVRDLGRVDYRSTWQSMQHYTEQRGPDADDEIWLVEHDRVFTQGQAGKAEHLLSPGDIPVVQVDRGGQVTYHGPGQLVAYALIDIRRAGSDVRKFVSCIEDSVVAVLNDHGLDAAPRPDAPGVYVGDRKICSLGLRIKRGCSYHGLALNVDMDLEPFGRINPCGYQGMRMTQMTDHVGPVEMAAVKRAWVRHFCAALALEPRWTTEPLRGVA